MICNLRQVKHTKSTTISVNVCYVDLFKIGIGKYVVIHRAFRAIGIEMNYKLSLLPNPSACHLIGISVKYYSKGSGRICLSYLIPILVNTYPLASIWWKLRRRVQETVRFNEPKVWAESYLLNIYMMVEII